MEKFDQKIYSYKIISREIKEKGIKKTILEFDDKDKPYKIYNKKKEMENYLNKVKIFQDNPNKINTDEYGKLDSHILNDFDEIVGMIENIRSNSKATRNNYPLRVKTTLNNPSSSRSILYYDFQIPIKTSGNKKEYVQFMVMDLPGQENIVESFT